MKHHWQRGHAWLRARAENVLALLMAAMFVSFILQIFFRYVINLPVAWTEEVCVIGWLWGILWGAGFVTRNSEDVRFDMVYGLVPRPVKRGFTVLASAAIVIILALSLPGAWSYVSFMKVEKSASLGIRMDWMFSIYIAFALATIARHAHIVVEALRGRLVDDHPTQHVVEDL
jgi:TRAP-type C4-dicarboxylate transport system permease small subunit